MFIIVYATIRQTIQAKMCNNNGRKSKSFCFYFWKYYYLKFVAYLPVQWTTVPCQNTKLFDYRPPSCQSTTVQSITKYQYHRATLSSTFLDNLTGVHLCTSGVHLLLGGRLFWSQIIFFFNQGTGLTIWVFHSPIDIHCTFSFF